MNKTIAQQLNIKLFPFEIKDVNGNRVYYEDSTGYWVKREYDTNGNQLYCEYSKGYWSKSKYDTNGNPVYYENSKEYWWKSEYDTNGKCIYYEDSYGIIEDNRPKQTVEITLDEIAKALNIPVNQLKIKK